MPRAADSDRPAVSQRGIDRVCEQFESAWRAGRAVTIEELVREPRPSDRKESLLAELIAVEIELRREQGATPTSDEFVRRFPWCSKRIHLLFSELHNEDSPSGLHQERLPAQRNESANACESLLVPGYNVLEELGRGSMGVVHKARDIELNRLVALKFIHPEAPLPTVAKRHFRHEARTIANLHHCGIVQIFGIDELEGQPYLVLELIDGCGLNQWLGGAPQQHEWAALLAARIARTLEYAHQQGVIHRDIKPANILLTSPRSARSYAALDAGLPRYPGSDQSEPDDVPMPVITDFGLAKHLFSGMTVGGKGAMLGTPSYMPPEQAEGRSSEVTPASDIYSLGAVLYEMLTGRAPVEGATPLETLRNVYREKPVPVRRLQPDVPRELESICHRCLHRDPANRFPTASALTDALHGYLAEASADALRLISYNATHRGFSKAVNSRLTALNRFLDRRLSGLSLRRSA